MVFTLPAAEVNIGHTRDAQPRWIVLHSTEGGGFPRQPSALGVARYFANPNQQTADGKPLHVSAHVIVDDVGVYRSVADNRSANAVGKANPWTLNLEIAGFRKWSREEWLSHDDTIQNAAEVIAVWANRFGIPAHFLLPSELDKERMTSRGVTTHEDINKSYHGTNGDHGDPGPNFPYDVVLERVKDILDGPEEYLLSV